MSDIALVGTVTGDPYHVYCIPGDINILQTEASMAGQNRSIKQVLVVGLISVRLMCVMVPVHDRGRRRSGLLSG